MTPLVTDQVQRFNVLAFLFYFSEAKEALNEQHNRNLTIRMFHLCKHSECCSCNTLTPYLQSQQNYIAKPHWSEISWNWMWQKAETGQILLAERRKMTIFFPIIWHFCYNFHNSWQRKNERADSERLLFGLERFLMYEETSKNLQWTVKDIFSFSFPWRSHFLLLNALLKEWQSSITHQNFLLLSIVATDHRAVSAVPQPICKADLASIHPHWQGI